MIVIDTQESFRHRLYSPECDTPAYLLAQNALIAACAARDVPIVRVLHVDGPETKDNPFALESGHVVPLEGLAGFTPAAAFTKGRHSALVGTGLDIWLTQHGIGRLIISGIRTGQCCETTTIRTNFSESSPDAKSSATACLWSMGQCSPALT